MSTNYYWKELMPELREIAEFKHCDLTYVGPLIHIGHSAYAGGEKPRSRQERGGLPCGL